MSRSTTLEQLWLVDCKLKSSLNDLISELGEFSRLRLLDISGNEIGDFGLNLLSKSLQVNRSLETLVFDRSNATLTAYSHIIDSMKRYTNTTLFWRFHRLFIDLVAYYIAEIRTSKRFKCRLMTFVYCIRNRPIN
jgi:hypothetical protein